MPTVAAPPLAPAAKPPANPAASLVSDDVILALTTQPASRLEISPLPRAISAGLVLTMLQDVADNMRETLNCSWSRAHDDDAGYAGCQATAAIRRRHSAAAFSRRAAIGTGGRAAGVGVDDAPAVVAHKLIEDVDGALARQTLLQIASLPEQPVRQGQRSEQPRWAFEIPFATPQGTAVAQFEISRDGHSSHEADQPKRIWRARFSLNVEPAGPVHAAIALTGERASVRLWADRPETIARLRDSTPLLSHALREADLDPGEITVGRPPQSAPVAAGQFWNQAS